MDFTKEQQTESTNTKKNFMNNLKELYNCQPQEIVFMSESQLERLTKY